MANSAVVLSHRSLLPFLPYGAVSFDLPGHCLYPIRQQLTSPLALWNHALDPGDMLDEPQEPPQQLQPKWVGVSHADCDKMLQYALKRDPTVKFMVEKMKEVQLLPLQGNHVLQASVHVKSA